MICPACKLAIHFKPSGNSEAYAEVHDEKYGFDVAWGFCPACERLIVLLREGQVSWSARYDERIGELFGDMAERVIHPNPAPPHVEPEVPEPYRSDFIEASLVLPLSAKGSAALSRRVLQMVLRGECKLEARNLAEELEMFLQQPGVPQSLSNAIHAVRQLGNIAAHPTHDRETGEMLSVEPGEAEWLLEVVQALFDFVFVQPTRLRERRQALDAKLARVKRSPQK